jgi:NTP pyrophosphatase (non-canonical NTP hydrolase)
VTLNEYQDQLMDMHTQRPDSLTYAILGIVGEAGEVAEAYKKALREMEPDYIPTSVDHSMKLAQELGDVLWYTAKVAKLLSYTLEDIARLNMEKLEARREQPLRES